MVSEHDILYFSRNSMCLAMETNESCTSIIENRRLITAYPCFEADNDSAEPANQNTKIDSNTALIVFISPLYTRALSTSHDNGMRMLFT